MNPLKVGIIGCGNIAKTVHAPALFEHPKVQLLGFASRTKQRAIDLARQYGHPNAQVYADARALIEDPNLDVVHICTPNNTHALYAQLALEHGKHVMVEKPPAHDYASALKMFEALKQSDRQMSVMFHNRYRGETEALKKAIDAGQLGEIYYAEAHAIRRRGVPTWGHFTNQTIQGGGPLLDIGSHALDLVLYLLGNDPVVTVMGTTYQKLKDQGHLGNDFGPWKPEDYTVEDSAFAMLRTRRNATIIVRASFALNIAASKEAAVTLAGTRAGADLQDSAIIHTYEKGEPLSKRLESKQTAAHTACIHAFIDALIANRPVPISFESALAVQQVISAIYDSAATKQTITL